MNATPQLHTMLAEKLLMGALHEQDLAMEAEVAAERAACLARLSRELSLSLDEEATRETIRHVQLPRPGSWCIADIVEADGSIHRLPVVHPQPSKQHLAAQLERHWSPGGTDVPIPRALLAQPTLLSHLSGEALLRAVHSEESLKILTAIGFSSLLVVPLVVRAHVHGALIFVSPPDGPAFSAEETALAVDLASRCGLALDNARLFHEADVMRRAAQQANQSKSEFLRGMSHELRTPLNAIAGFTQLIEMGIQGPVTADQHASLARIRSNQEHLLALITEILSFARIESGRMTYATSEVVLASALASVADMLTLAVAEAGMVVEGPAPDADAVAWADPDKTRQILVNLVTNAVKYAATPGGGTITLRCSHSGDTVSASVSDTGPGIPPEKLDSIFEPFVQLPAETTNRRQGVGLGLAISRDLAIGMRGDLSVASEVGRGTTFTLTLPRARHRTHKGDLTPPRGERAVVTG